MKLEKRNLILVTVTALAFLAGCSSRPTQKEVAGTDKAPIQPPSIEAQQLAAEQNVSFVAELQFQMNSATLSKLSRSKIRNLLHEASLKGEVEEVKVITWADAEYPSVNTKKLSTDERKIVEKRNKSIERYIKTLPGSITVTPYSMAERPGAIKELFDTTDARIKKSLETAGIPNTDTTVKVPSKVAKSIVLVLVADKNKGAKL